MLTIVTIANIRIATTFLLSMSESTSRIDIPHLIRAWFGIGGEIDTIQTIIPYIGMRRNDAMQCWQNGITTLAIYGTIIVVGNRCM